MGGVVFASTVLGWLTPVIYNFLPSIAGKLYGVTLLPYLWMFMLAAFAAEYQEKVLPFLKSYWWLFIGVLLILKQFLRLDIQMNIYYGLFDTLLLFCGIVGFSYRYPKVNVKTDISYGIYIYHMTVINALMALGFIGQRWTLWVVIGLTCLLAWISTITIGQLSISKKRKIAH